MTHPEDFASGPAPDDGPLDDAPPDDVPLDAEWRAAAAQYRVPASVPADAMWAAIQARRTATGTAAGAAVPPADAVPAEPSPEWAGPRAVHVTHLPRGRGVRQRPVWRRAPLAAAAVLLFSVGVGIGRRTAPESVAPNGTASGATATEGPGTGGVAARVAAGGTAAPGRPLPPPPPGAPPAGRRVAASGAPVRSAAGGRAVAPPAAPAPAIPALVAAAPVGGGRRGGAPDGMVVEDGPAAGASAPLRAVTAQHLAQVEALLTAFAGHAPDAAPQRADAAPDSAWARDLLTTTRLLLDSPAGHDAGRRALFESLELVLVQIARLPRADSPAERALIDRAIRQGDLIAKLRAAPPAPHPASARGT
jgi:hypothetical protein